MHNHVMCADRDDFCMGPRHGSCDHRILPDGCARAVWRVCFADRAWLTGSAGGDVSLSDLVLACTRRRSGCTAASR